MEERFGSTSKMLRLGGNHNVLMIIFNLALSHESNGYINKAMGDYKELTDKNRLDSGTFKR